ncbi:MAG: hypothetical protein JSV62_10910 [Promethearchaeota archaeon]|nr:MAG: hypothetical protein JSV62_10910 [Candidatus Lokiarchaeota archaeon]
MRILRDFLKTRIYHIFRLYDSLPIQPFSKFITKFIYLKYGVKNRNKRMIFGIGLSRTGTTSLNDALNQLGFKSKHFIYFPISGKIPYWYYTLNNYSGATDTPVAANYKRLTKLYPNAKFILTIREINSWLESCEKFFKYQFHMKKMRKWVKQIHLKLYNSLYFDYESFKKGYYQHLNGVLEFFKNKPNNLLILDINAGDGFEKICPFLGLEVINKKFPHKNIAKKI